MGEYLNKMLDKEEHSPEEMEQILRWIKKSAEGKRKERENKKYVLSTGDIEGIIAMTAWNTKDMKITAETLLGISCDGADEIIEILKTNNFFDKDWHITENGEISFNKK